MTLIILGIVVILLVYGIRVWGNHGRQSMPNPKTPRGRAMRAEHMAQRRGLESREALAELRAPEAMMANSPVQRPLGIDFRATQTGGVAVIGIHRGSPAARINIPVGAVLTSIGGLPTPDESAVNAALGRQVPGLAVRLAWTFEGVENEAEVIL